MSKVTFDKMHGIGNDFVVLDGRDDSLTLAPDFLVHLGDRRRGVGCDQILVVTRSQAAGCEFGYRVYNSDGSEAEQCGNGVRCVARWLHDRGAIKNSALLQSAAGPVAVEMLPEYQVRVDMGAPKFTPTAIPFIWDKPASRYHFEVDGHPVDAAVLSMGNPHAVIAVESARAAAVEELGAALQHHPLFPKAVNVGFVEVVDKDHVQLRVYERGVGETRACGTGACAAAVACIRWGSTHNRVQVSLPGGQLTIEWSGNGAHVMMTGSAKYAFSGSIAIT